MSELLTVLGNAQPDRSRSGPIGPATAKKPAGDDAFSNVFAEANRRNSEKRPLDASRPRRGQAEETGARDPEASAENEPRSERELVDTDAGVPEAKTKDTFKSNELGAQMSANGDVRQQDQPKRPPVGGSSDRTIFPAPPTVDVARLQPVFGPIDKLYPATAGLPAPPQVTTTPLDEPVSTKSKLAPSAEIPRIALERAMGAAGGPETRQDLSLGLGKLAAEKTSLSLGQTHSGTAASALGHPVAGQSATDEGQVRPHQMSPTLGADTPLDQRTLSVDLARGTPQPSSPGVAERSSQLGHAKEQVLRDPITPAAAAAEQQTKANGQVPIGQAGDSTAPKSPAGAVSGPAVAPVQAVAKVHISDEHSRSRRDRVPLDGAPAIQAAAHSQPTGVSPQTAEPATPSQGATAGQQEPAFALGAQQSLVEETSISQVSPLQTGDTVARTFEGPPGTQTHLAARPELARDIGRQMATSITAMADGSIDIALSPKELGTVRLSLSMSEAGVTLLVTGERQETIDLMRRHSDSLQSAFRDLGYENIAFSFGTDGSGGAQDEDSEPRNHATSPGGLDETQRHPAQEQGATSMSSQRSADGRLDIRI